MKNDIKLFEEKQVRVQWDEKSEKWYLPVIDIISTLTDSTIPKRYWSDLKKKLTLEGSQLYEKIVQLKFKSRDGKSCVTYVQTESPFFVLSFMSNSENELFE